MYISLNSLSSVVRKIIGFALVLLCFTLLGWSLPAQAATRISPQLEQQILEVIREHPEVVIESVQAYQQQQQQQLQQRQQAFLQQLKTNPQDVIGESPTAGAAESKIVLIEFSDYQCPYCAQAHKTLKQLMASHPGEFELVYKHLPLAPVHPEALPAAQAAWAAGQQGKFWEYHDALFAQPDKLGEEFYIDIAQKLNLDMEKFNSDRTSDASTAAIGQDIRLAEQLGLPGTPFFVMNSEAFSGAVQLSDIENVLTRVSKS